jgi:hypothetical protein
MKSLVYVVLLVTALMASAKAQTESESKEKSTKAISLPGRYVQALLAVAEQRAKDKTLSNTERDLSNFDVVVADSDTKIIEVHYLPHALGTERPNDEANWDRSGDTALGRALVYGVRRKDFHIEWVKRFR